MVPISGCPQVFFRCLTRGDYPLQLFSWRTRSLNSRPTAHGLSTTPFVNLLVRWATGKMLTNRPAKPYNNPHPNSTQTRQKYLLRLSFSKLITQPTTQHNYLIPGISYMRVCFTLNHSFYPSTSSTPSVRVDFTSYRDAGSVVKRHRHRDTPQLPCGLAGLGPVILQLSVDERTPTFSP